jgi:hypothetical protein
MKKNYNKLVPVILLFLLVNLSVIALRNFLHGQGFAIRFLLAANLILFCLSVAGFFIQIKTLSAANVHAFARGIYTSLLLKIFTVIGVLGAYLYINGGNVNRPSLFTAMALYILYTAVEVKQLMKISTRKSNA